MRIDNPLSMQLERYLDMATAQTRLTVENMANIDTPGYRAVGMDFAAEMSGALADEADGQPARSVRVRPEDGLVARPDGNNVSMDRESLTLAEAQLKFKTGVALLRQQYQMIVDAIHADK